MALISVIVPVYKVENYLPRCVESILGQTLGDFQLILVNDGSPDRCPQLCRDYARRDGRIVLLEQENRGLSSARNLALDWAFAHSDSPWFAFVDSDDWVHPRFLESLYRGAEGLGCPVASCNWQRIADGEPPIQPTDFSAKALSPELVYQSKNNDYDVASFAWRFLVRRELFQGVRYPLGRQWEDLFTSYKLLFQGPAVAACDAVLYYYYIRGDSIARSPWSPRRFDMLDALEENLAFFRRSAWPGLYERLLRCYGATVRRQQQLLAQSPLSPDEKARYSALLAQRLQAVEENAQS